MLLTCILQSQVNDRHDVGLQPLFILELFFVKSNKTNSFESLYSLFMYHSGGMHSRSYLSVYYIFLIILESDTFGGL